MHAQEKAMRKIKVRSCGFFVRILQSEESSRGRGADKTAVNVANTSQEIYASNSHQGTEHVSPNANFYSDSDGEGHGAKKDRGQYSGMISPGRAGDSPGEKPPCKFHSWCICG